MFRETVSEHWAEQFKWCMLMNITLTGVGTILFKVSLRSYERNLVQLRQIVLENRGVRTIDKYI